MSLAAKVTFSSRVSAQWLHQAFSITWSREYFNTRRLATERTYVTIVSSRERHHCPYLPNELELRFWGGCGRTEEAT